MKPFRSATPLFALSATLAGIAVMALSVALAAPGTITSPVGNNTWCGDGGVATSACLNLPTGIGFDTSGNLFIADNENHRIRKVTPGATPMISAYGGTGLGSFCGDGGMATSACFQFPIGVVADTAGNVYVGDSNNNRVRKITPAGIVTTFAGSSASTFCGDGGPATAACLNSPRGLTFDGAGNLYIADAQHNRIRVVDHLTANISTYAGSGVNGFCGDGGAATAACLSHPRGVKFDTGGNLFIADENNNRIRRVDGVTKNITTVAGNGALGYGGDGGAATAAMLSHPRGVALDASNNLLIADSDNDRVRKVVGGNISTIAGNGASTYCGDGGAATSACVNSPDDLVFDAGGNLYIAAALDHRIRKVTSGGIISTYAGSATFCGDGGPATAACLNDPQGIERRGPTDPLYIADTTNHRVRVVTGTTITTYAGTGSASFCGDGGPATSACLWSPRGLAANAGGDLYIADTTNNRIRRIDAVTKIITTVAGTGTAAYSGDGGAATAAALNGPRDVFIDGSGDLWIADSANNAVREVVPGADGIVNGGPGETIATVAGNGVAADCLDGSAAATACLNAPNGIFVDASGLIVADTSNQKVKLVAAGVFKTIAGNGTFVDAGDGAAATSAGIHEPSSVIKDAGGNLFISSHLGDRVRKVVPGAGGVVNGAPDNLISSVVGGSAAGSGFCGDGGAASAACLTLPRSIVLDTSGNLYIADQGNRRIREVEAIGVAPATTPTATSRSVGGVAMAPDLPPAAGSRTDSGAADTSRLGWFAIAGVAAAGALGLSVVAVVRRRRA